MLYGFVEDEALWKKQASAIIDETKLDQGVGYFHGNIKNYYTLPMRVVDPRTTEGRLDVLNNTPMAGDISLWFDNHHIPPEDGANMITSEQWKHIFNIVELTLYTANMDLTQMETHLTTHIDKFGLYKPSSLVVSTSVKDTNITLSNGSVQSNNVRKYVMFEYNTDGYGIVKFKLWSDSVLFAIDYPLYEITRVVPPCNPTAFLNVSMVNTINTIIASANYGFPIIENEVTERDHSGVYIYKTKFVNVNETGTYTIPFTIFYKGRTPSIISIRVAIREFLERTEGVDPELWKNLFPDLYTDKRVYIIPIWDNTYDLYDRTIFPSIIVNSTVPDIINRIFPGLSPSFIERYACTLTCDATSATLISIPDESNSSLETLLEMHPTYRNMDATNKAWDTQTTQTQEFNIRLCNAISLIDGSIGTTVDNFRTVDEDGKMWVVFNAGIIEYCVLYKDSYVY